MIEDKDFKEEKLDKDIEKGEDNLAKTRIINHKKYCVRERNTSAGRKGTIMGCPKKKQSQRRLIPEKAIRDFFGR